MARLHNDRTTRWFVAFVSAAALAMTLAAAFGAFADGESEPATAVVAGTGTSGAGDAGGDSQLTKSIGGPDAPDDPPKDVFTDQPVAIAEAERTGTFAWPVRGSLEQGTSPWHPGLDIGTAFGVPVRASRDGTVTFVGGDPCCSYGTNIIIRHGGGWATRYAHLDSVAVALGQQVAQGDLLGTVGVTGYTTGPHLHFEILYNDAPVDPLSQLPGGEGMYAPVATAPPAGTSDSGPANDADVPEPSPTPEPRPTSASPSVAIGLAVNYLNAGGEYVVVPGTCAAAPATGSQWFVTCNARDTGCVGTTSCVRTHLICVLETPVTVWAC